MRRREFLHSTVAVSTVTAAGLNISLAADSNASKATAARGPAQAFDYALLKGRARALAASPYKGPPNPPPKSLIDLTYDQYQAIRFRRDQALWAREQRGFRLEFFHLGRGFKEPVEMYEIVDGQAREIRYQPALFDFTQAGVDTRALKPDLGFAGFRIHAATNWEADVAAFLGASYFRAVGNDTRQFGLSARGLAIDTAMDVEEFPRFVSWWFERPPENSRTLVMYGLLDSPGTTGAYRFALTPGAPTITEVDAAVYPRKAIRRLGIAPLTSMFQCGENDKRAAYDWRPEIHDSDGLAVWSGAGEWIWRPLTNPNGIRVNSYFDENPRGFGLLQRDRDFSNYQDDGVFYDRRPSLWIEPKAGWGKGAIQLVELPTADETFDNIVAYWNPAAPVKAGDELLYAYRMFWGTQMPANPPLARAIATRTGLGGVIGQKRRYFSWRFAVDFLGGELPALPERAKVEPVISVSRGTVEITSARPLAAGPHSGASRGYRAMFDIKPTDDSLEPIDIRMFLQYENQPLTETWIYQWVPPTPEARRHALMLSGDLTT
jgi:glucans biosynthesis protein